MPDIALTNTDGEMLVHIPMTLTKRQGRKQIVIAEGGETAHPPHDLTTDPLALAIARGFRWQTLLDNGTYLTVRALAQAIQQDQAYVARTLRLTLLAPEFIEAIMTGHCPPGLSLKQIALELPSIWDEQRHKWGLVPMPATRRTSKGGVT